MSKAQRRQFREREQPGPSVVWQTLGIAFCGFAFTAGIAALTISNQVTALPGELWVAAAGLALAAVLCFAAHHDVNRGRKSRCIELEELPPKDGR